MVIARLDKCLNFTYDLVLYLNAFSTFRFLDLLQRVSMHYLLKCFWICCKGFFYIFYRSNVPREDLVELCGDEYVQRMTFDGYLYNKLAHWRVCDYVKLFLSSIGSLVRYYDVGTHMKGLIL